MQVTPLVRFTAPLGREEIELHEVRHDAGGMKLLRVRIREQSRFTVIDIDPATAAEWGRAMQGWAAAQSGDATNRAT